MSPEAASPLSELDEIAGSAKSIESTARLVDDGDEGGLLLQVVQQTNAYGLRRTWRAGQITRGGRLVEESRGAATLAGVMQDLASKGGPLGRLDPESITCKSSQSPVKGKALKDLCFDAWYEAFGVAPPTPAERAAARKAKQGPADAARREKANETRRGRRELLDLLAEGPAGVKAWNRRFDEAKALAPFRKARLAGLDLRSARLVDMPEADFSGADLGRARLAGCNLAKAVFRDTNLAGAALGAADLKDADLTGAILEGAKLARAQLEGAVLTLARLDGASLKDTRFDESTVWPEGFQPPIGTVWTGAGPSPVALAALDEERSESGPVDLETFMKRLDTSVDKGPLSKALKMLKKDRFELFVEVEAGGLTGVVKSQTDPRLVYACRLGAGGEYGCCTQNLNRCGGLRGGLCKHLLLLVVGMAQAGSADADTLDLWVQRSALHEAEIDQEALGAILLRYKGAQAGEIDWRPAETMPEDFYAF